GHGLSVSADRIAISYDGEGALSPSTQDTVFTAQGSNLLPFDLGAGAIVWTMARADGTLIDSVNLTDQSGVGAELKNFFAWSERLDQWGAPVGTLTCVKAADPPSVPIQFWDVSDTDAATASYLPISR